MKLLVTGGAGFIGSNFIEYMLNKYQDIEIICLDLLTYAANINNLNSIKDDDRFHFVHGDICDDVLLEELYNNYKFNIIINFAAETHVDRSLNDSTPFIKSNIIGVHKLLELARKHNIYLHQISTDEVYGGKSIDDCTFYTTKSRLNPTNPYAASKASGDLLVLAYIRTYNIKATISRSSNNYGKNQHSEKFIPHCLDLIKNHKKLEIYGEGKEKRDYIPVEFNIFCIDQIIHNPIKTIYNICSEEEYSSLEIAHKILDYYHLDYSNIIFINNRLNHDGHYPMKSSFSYKRYKKTFNKKKN